MAEPASPGLLTVEEYLAFEETSDIRHEYVGGLLYAMAGGTLRHNRISGNIYARFRSLARGTPCQVYMSDVRAQIGNVYYYPDVMVACGEVESDDIVSRSDPCVLVEVVSTGSSLTDRREKWQAYSTIPSLRLYLMVHQDSRRVERHFRDEGGEWRRGDMVNEGRFPVPCLETVLTLADIYEDL